MSARIPSNPNIFENNPSTRPLYPDTLMCRKAMRTWVQTPPTEIHVPRAQASPIRRTRPRKMIAQKKQRTAKKMIPISCQNSRTLTTIVHQWSCFGLVLAFCLCVYIVDRKNNIFCVSKLHQSVVILWSPKHWFLDDDSAWFNWVEDFSLVFSNS